MFVLASSNQDNNSKSIKPKGIINQKILWRNKKVMTRQNVGYTTGCSLDYDYIKSHYRLIAVDLSRQKQLNADRKAIQQIHFFGAIKKDWCCKCWWYIIYSFDNFRKKIIETIQKFSQGNIIKDGEMWRNKNREVREGKGITLVISYEHMDDAIKIIKSFENSDLLIDEVSETQNMKLKSRKVDFLVYY